MLSSHFHYPSLRLLTAFCGVAKMGVRKVYVNYMEKNLPFWSQLFKESITVEIRRRKEVKD